MPSPWMNKPGPLPQFMTEMREEAQRLVKLGLAELGRKVEAATDAAGEAKRQARDLERAIEDLGLGEHLDGIDARLTALESKPKPRPRPQQKLAHLLDEPPVISQVNPKRASSRKAKTTEKAA